VPFLSLLFHLKGILKYCTIKIVPFVSYTSPSFKNNEKLIIEAPRTCKNTNETQPIEVEISGLSSFKSYRVSLTALHANGLTSDDPEQLVANTLESSPSHIAPLRAAPNYEQLDDTTTTNFILFTFQDPEQPNGALAAFNLYQIAPITHTLRLIYSGLRRDFIHWNLKPFWEYSYVYELC